MQTLAQYLAEAGLTQAQFAKQVSTTDATVSRWCTGKAFPSPDAIRRIDTATNGKVPPGIWFAPAIPEASPTEAA